MKRLLAQLARLLAIKTFLGVPHFTFAGPHRKRSLFAERAFSHSLGSPLTTLLLTLDSCIDDPEKLSDSKTVEKLLLARDHLEALYTTWKHGQEQHRGIFTVSSTVQETIILTGLAEKSNLTTQFSLHEDTKLFGNKILFQEMLSCLLINAYESYSDDDPHKSIICGIKQGSTSLQIDIIDSGAGMNKLAQLFAGFSGVSFKTTGTGVGLSFARAVAMQVFGGTLYICSLPKQGTRVSIRLPLKSSIAKAADRFDTLRIAS